jgi:hypothetical protein
VDDEKLLKGKSSDAIIAACIYIGCREQNLARTFKEICALTKVSKKEIGRCYKLLQPFFEIRMCVGVNLDSCAVCWNGRLHLQVLLKSRYRQGGAKRVSKGCDIYDSSF